MAYIELNDLSFAYPGPAGEVKALEHVSFSVHGGEFLSAVGRSGCGKSTLLRLLAGLEEPGSGSVTIGGEPASVPGRGRMIVFQTGGLFPWQTVRGNVIFAMRQTHRGLSRAESAERADALLQTVELADAAGLYPYQLSGGMAQRAAIARALAVDAGTLLLDEPFSALDVQTRAQLQRLIERVWENAPGERKTVIFVTHDINEALLLSGRVICMRPRAVAGELAVEFPRPRCGSAVTKTAEFAAARERLLALMGGEVEK
ncbi:MAG TPA: ABC transporter ATP-binding protein [Candidatus Scatomorpha stercorigallinarum]|nr:ABC transporter ATP-binding protein [Candidatus Scatomorpha stercorigallinarum]